MNNEIRTAYKYKSVHTYISSIDGIFGFKVNG